METVKKESFKVIGISVRTQNHSDKALKDITGLWGRFMGEGIADKIPNKVSNDVLAIYTNYDGDYTEPYDMILGCRVSTLTNVPEGMISQTFSESSYVKFEAKGDLSKGVVYQAWEKIWQTDLKRKYTADFEVYGEKAQNPADPEVNIFIGVKA